LKLKRTPHAGKRCSSWTLRLQTSSPEVVAQPGHEPELDKAKPARVMHQSGEGDEGKGGHSCQAGQDLWHTGSKCGSSREQKPITTGVKRRVCFLFCMLNCESKITSESEYCIL